MIVYGIYLSLIHTKIMKLLKEDLNSILDGKYLCFTGLQFFQVFLKCEEIINDF